MAANDDEIIELTEIVPDEEEEADGDFLKELEKPLPTGKTRWRTSSPPVP